MLPPDGTSTTCPECGHESDANRPNLRKWFECVVCGHREHSGTVAARNLLRRAGHARIACGEVAQSGPSVKQEPTEATAHGAIHA
jgi:putative transposase